jgi:transcriptional regulator with XRE-family HTH domain
LNDCGPEHVLPHAKIKRWWLCADGHKWKTSPANRNGTKASGCPACEAKWSLPVFQAWLEVQLASGVPANWQPLLARAGVLASRGRARIVAEALSRGLLRPKELAAFAAGDLDLDFDSLAEHPTMADVRLFRKSISAADRRATLAADGYRCQLCGTSEALEIDHFIPVTLGGTNSLSNYWTLCTACNGMGGKGSRMPTAAMIEHWLASDRVLPAVRALIAVARAGMRRLHFCAASHIARKPLVHRMSLAATEAAGILAQGMPRSLTSHIAPGLGDRLTSARERAGLSQRQLSFPGCTSAYVSRIEAGERNPSLQILHELADRLDCDRDWLATGRRDTSGDRRLHARLREVEKERDRLQRQLDRIAALAIR